MDAVVLGLGRADAEGLRGSGGVDVRWDDLGVAPGGTGRTYKQLFGSAHPNFRRFDLSARLLVMAAEATGLADLIAEPHREDTVLVVETERGCLQTDRRFTDSLGQEMVDSGAFPYTLSNTVLGEVAIRHRLRGTTFCLSVGADEDGAAVDEALSLLGAGPADDTPRHALVGRVECLDAPVAGLEPRLLAVVAVLAVGVDAERGVAAPVRVGEPGVFAGWAGELAPAG